MRSNRAAIGGVTGILCALILISCGGGSGYGGSGGGTTAAVVSVTVSPTRITVGQSATVNWTSSSGTSCAASGAWSGAQSASGSTTVTPTTAGSAVYTLTCSGGAYSSTAGSTTLTIDAASAYAMTSLVADTTGPAGNTDAHLVNPWGLSIPTGTAPAWLANNGTDTSTLYDGDGKPQPHASPLVVSFQTAGFDATGIVSNASTTDFAVSAGGKTGIAKFIFSGEGGMIAGWAPSVDPAHALTTYTAANGAVYKGLAIAQKGGSSFLYAADFHNAKVDVFDATFAKQATSGSAFTFADPAIPAGYAPFGVQAIANGAGGTTQIYVSYAQQLAPANHDESDGTGLGYVDIYDTNGQLIKQLIARGALNAPWGFALAPTDFGSLSKALLVGNFGDGVINGFDAASGAFIGSVGDSTGATIKIQGLWGMAFGNDANNQPHNTLFFAAGTNAEANGLYGRIDLGAAPVLNAPPVVAVPAATGTLRGTVSLSASVQDPIGITKVDFFANSALIGTATTAPYAISWVTTTVADGTLSITATATDKDGNVGSSTPIAVTVANTVAP